MFYANIRFHVLTSEATGCIHIPQITGNNSRKHAHVINNLLLN
uniref:Uncharacterized protein n=1 Tax=Anguilla anguilla TaxID=7936 RepID=A0A0E9VUY6_ANGAN